MPSLALAFVALIACGCAWRDPRTGASVRLILGAGLIETPAEAPGDPPVSARASAERLTVLGAAIDLSSPGVLLGVIRRERLAAEAPPGASVTIAVEREPRGAERAAIAAQNQLPSVP